MEMPERKRMGLATIFFAGIAAIALARIIFQDLTPWWTVANVIQIALGVLGLAGEIWQAKKSRAA